MVKGDVEIGDICPSCEDCRIAYGIDWSDYIAVPVVHELYEDYNKVCIDRDMEVTYFHVRRCWDDGAPIP